MRERLAKGDIIKDFDRQVFESIVDYVILGGYNEEGNADPSMITFVYRTGFKDRKDGDHFRPARLNASKKNTSSGSSSMRECQVDGTRPEETDNFKNYSGLQSSTTNDWDILQSNTTLDGHCIRYNQQDNENKKMAKTEP